MRTFRLLLSFVLLIISQVLYAAPTLQGNLIITSQSDYNFQAYSNQTMTGHVIVKNVGEKPVTNITLSLQPSGLITLQSSTCGSVLAPGDTCSFALQYQAGADTTNAVEFHNVTVMINSFENQPISYRLSVVHTNTGAFIPVGLMSGFHGLQSVAFQFSSFSTEQSVISFFSVKKGSQTILYAGTYDNLFMSSDLGKTWLAVLGIGPKDSLERHNAGYGAIQIVAGSNALYAAMGSEIYRSMNGMNWIKMGEPDAVKHSMVKAIAMVQRNGQEMLYATMNIPDGLRVSENGGKTWQIVNSNPAATVGALGLFNLNNQVLYYANANGEVYETTDEKTWKLVKQFGSTNASTLYATVNDSKTYLYVGGASGVNVSLDGGNTWGNYLNNYNITAIKTVNENGVFSVYVGTTMHGVYQSKDNKAWQSINEFANQGVDTISQVQQPNNSMLFFGIYFMPKTFGGLVSTTDLTHWQHTSYGYAPPAVAMLPEHATLYAGNINSNDGVNWWESNSGPALKQEYRVNQAGQNTLYGLTDSVKSAEFYSSTDGTHWQVIANPQHYNFASFLPVTADGETMFYGGLYGFTGAAGMYSSIDLSNWQLVTQFQQYIVNPLAAVDMHGHVEAYAANQMTSELYRSIDNKHWQVIKTFPNHLVITSMVSAIDGDTTILYMGTTDGIYKSTDGDNWQLIPNSPRAEGLLVVSVNGINHLYVSTGGGIVTSVDGEHWVNAPDLDAQVIQSLSKVYLNGKWYVYANSNIDTGYMTVVNN